MLLIYCFYLRIDKFLEGYSSDGEELPVKNNNELDEEILPVHIKKNELCISKTINEINTSNCVSIYMNIHIIYYLML